MLHAVSLTAVYESKLTACSNVVRPVAAAWMNASSIYHQLGLVHICVQIKSTSSELSLVAQN